MNDWKCAITLTTCCGICLTIAASASADFVGVTTVIKDDPDTVALCNSGAGPFNFGFGPMTVCNVFAAFDNPNDALLSVGNADLQVYNGENPSVFYQHPFVFDPFAPSCGLIPNAPDAICDTFITIGYKCGPIPPGPLDQTTADFDFMPDEFANNGHIVGGWYNAAHLNGQGEAGTWPDLRVLFLQSAVGLDHTMSGDIDLFWWVDIFETYAELDVPIECVATCGFLSDRHRWRR